MVNQVCRIGSPPSPKGDPIRQPPTKKATGVTKQDLLNAIQFLERVYVGQTDQDRLIQTIEALKLELARRNKK